MRMMPSAACSTVRPSGLAIFASIAARGGFLHLHPPAEQRDGIEPVQDDVGIRQRDLGAAAAIGDRAGIGTRAVRADSAPASSIQAMDPPPAPMTYTSTIGVRTG